MSTTPPVTPPPAPPSYNQQMLTQIRAVLQGKLLDDVAIYKIGGRELTKIPLPDLMKAEAYYESRVRQELRRQNNLPQRFVPIIFGSAETWRDRLLRLRNENPELLAWLLVMFWLLVALIKLVFKLVRH